MEREVQTWLEDIKQAIEEIEQFLPEQLNFYAFQKDIKSRKAIERNIEITNARKIVDTRNRISHGYDNVSEDIIWTIVIKDITHLKKEINNLL